MRTAGGVGVRYGVGVEVGIGVLVRVALGDGRNVDVAEVCAVDAQAAKNNKLIKNRLWYFLINLFRCGLQ